MTCQLCQDTLHSALTKGKYFKGLYTFGLFPGVGGMISLRGEEEVLDTGYSF